MIEYNILKYAFILEYLIKNDSLFIDKYKLLLFKELIKINVNYSYLIDLNNTDLLKEIQKIIKEYFKQLDI